MKITLGWAVFNTSSLAPVRTGPRGHRMPKIYSTYKRAMRYCTEPWHAVVPVVIDYHAPEVPDGKDVCPG